MARYDLHIQLVDPSEQTFGANFSFGVANPILVTGFQALVNRWMKIFMTPKGSHPVRRTEGTEFPYLLGSNVTDIPSLEATVAEYIDDATQQVQAVDRMSPNLTNDQRLRAAALLQFNAVDASSIEFWVELTNQANQRMRVLIPYLVTPNG
jgi:hypothetical protein